MLSVFTGRSLIVTDWYMVNGFDFIDASVDISELSSIKFSPSEANNFTSAMIPTAMYNILDFDEDIIVCGDGTDMGGNYLINNKNYTDLYESMLSSIGGSSYYDYLIYYWSPLIRINSKLDNIAKKTVDYDSVDYISVQFRSFYDSNYSNLSKLSMFMDRLDSVLLDKGILSGNVFITSDSEEVVRILIDRLSNFNIILSAYPMRHSAYFVDLESISDWVTIGKSKFAFTTSTSFATTAGVVFGTDMYLYDGTGSGGYIQDACDGGYIQDVFSQF